MTDLNADEQNLRNYQINMNSDNGISNKDRNVKVPQCSNFISASVF